VPVTTIKKLLERGGDPADMKSSIVKRILDGSIDLVVNTPHGVTSGGSPRVDGWAIRTAAVTADIPCITTVQGLGAAVQGIEALQGGNIEVRSLQDWAKEVRR
jgi:carbamoyl-phosphate synthase large subunit